MLWYGKNIFSNFKKVYKRRTYRCNLVIRTLAFPILRHDSLSTTTVFIYIPSDWGFVLLNPKSLNQISKLVYIFSDIYYFKIAVLQTFLKWHFNQDAHTLVLNNRYTSHFYRMYFHRITNIFYSFSRLFFTKLKIKGKGYYIYKNYRSTVTHQFGHSHRLFIYSYFISVKFLSKTSVFLFGSSKRDVFTVGQTIQSSKYINIFTGRGVRFTKQIVYKKTGKVSSYR